MSSYVKLNYKIIFHLMGLLIGVNGGFMLLATFVSYYYSDGVAAEMLEASVITIFLGLLNSIFSSCAFFVISCKNSKRNNS